MNYISSFLIALLLLSCASRTSNTSSASNETQQIIMPSFDADSAWHYINSQVLFGPRVPMSQAHARCADYLSTELRRHGATVTIQQGRMNTYDGSTVEIRNIIASYQPETKRRILLCAHWDSRPWADSDLDPANHKKPIDGADDGASGVGVLLEIARQLHKEQPTNVGIDIILFDAEDMGTPEFYTGSQKGNTWCLGSQYWAAHPHKPAYRANFGILLDMVGASDALFCIDKVSHSYAHSFAKKVWKNAQKLGFSNYFSDKPGGSIMDDHYYVNKIAKIPCIDIINYDTSRENGFSAAWHTMDDTMERIDKPTLNAVGKVVLYTIYNF